LNKELLKKIFKHELEDVSIIEEQGLYNSNKRSNFNS